VKIYRAVRVVCQSGGKNSFVVKSRGSSDPVWREIQVCDKCIESKLIVFVSNSLCNLRCDLLVKGYIRLT